jgi:hypothetical protein
LKIISSKRQRQKNIGLIFSTNYLKGIKPSAHRLKLMLRRVAYIYRYRSSSCLLPTTGAVEISIVRASPASLPIRPAS